MEKKARAVYFIFAYISSSSRRRNTTNGRISRAILFRLWKIPEGKNIMKSKPISKMETTEEAYETGYKLGHTMGRSELEAERLKENTCQHCGGLVDIRRPNVKIDCDHLYYPENCEVCKELTSWSWEDEFEAAYLTITNPVTWKDGKPVFYGHVYVSVFNALKDVVKNIEKEAYQRGARNQALLDASAIEEARKEIINTIRKWTKGKVVTKDKLRAFLNTLKEKK